ncbi:MAG: RNA methyltransferase [Candidatus Bathyarchaeia archaeon]
MTQLQNPSVIESPIRVILLGPETGGNIGSVARSMRNFQLNDLWIVKPKTPINNEAKAFAMGGLDILECAKVVGTLKKALKGVDLVVGTSSVVATSTSNLSRVSITPTELAHRVRAAKGTVGIIFGRESSGLSNREVEACDLMVTIPASRDYNVLNIATAASIIFYEIFHQRIRGRSFELASRPAMERLLQQFNRLLIRSNIQTHRRRLAQRAFRNVVSRSFVTKREASLLLGLFRKVHAELM